MLKPGTLVSVDKKVLKVNAPWGEYNIQQTQAHGWLWFIIKEDQVDDPRDIEPFTAVYECRSLVTGYIGRWYIEELKVAK